MARVLAESWERFHSGYPFFALFLDSPQGCFNPATERFETVSLPELEIPNLHGLLFKYTLLEVGTAVKPYLLKHLFRRYQPEKLLYLDADILILDSLERLKNYLEESNFLLTPHLLSPLPGDAGRPSDHDILKTGTYNLGFLGLRQDPEVERMLEWWSGKLYHHCIMAREQNLFVDQRWMDLAPGLFRGVRIIREAGYNVAYWNLHERSVSVGDKITVNGESLRFFHFSGFDAERPWMVSKYQDRFQMQDIGDAARIYAQYAGRLMEKGWSEAQGWKYDHNYFHNGVPIPLSLRRYYWSLGAAAESLGDPFSWQNGDSPWASRLRAIEACGIPLQNLLGKYPAASRQMVTDDSHDVRVQIYRSGIAGYSEAASLSREIPAGIWNTLVFELPDGIGNAPLRIDPGDEPGFIELGEILIHSLGSGQLLWRSAIPPGEQDAAIGGTAAWLAAGKGSCLVSFGDDPYIVLTTPPGMTGAVKLTLALRVNPSPTLAPEIANALIQAERSTAVTAQLQRDEAGKEVLRTQQELAHSQQELARSQQQFAGSQQDLAGSRQELAQSRQEFAQSQRELGRTQQELSQAQQELARAQHGLACSQQDLARTQEELEASEAGYGNAALELYARAEALAEIHGSRIWNFWFRFRRGLKVLQGRQSRRLPRRLARRIWLEYERRAISASGLLDRTWYLEQYPDVASARVDPVKHYLEQGAAEGRDPNPFFDSFWYLRQYPDVSQGGLNPLVHFLHHGAREGRNPSSRFDCQWYLRRYLDVACSGVNPLVHFLQRGAKEGREPKPVRKEPSTQGLKAGLAGREAKAEWDEIGRQRLRAVLEGDERLLFPRFERVAVSLVLVFYGQAHLSVMCLDSILCHAGSDYDVVIVDNASQDETPRLLGRVEGAEIIVNSENKGFGQACMQAVERCRGDYLCFLNNDALLNPDSLRRALANFADPRVGAVGGKILLADGRLQEAGSIIWSDGRAMGYGRGDDATAPAYEFRRPTDYCSGVFLLTPHEVFDRLGGFDPQFFPAYYEDSDYCMRVWLEGLKVVYEPQAVIRHYEYASSKKPESSISLMEEHWRRFREKWATALTHHLPAGPQNLLRARYSMRAPGLRILYIDDYVPHPEMGSGYTRAHTILSEFVKQGHFVTCAGTAGRLGNDEYRDLPREIELFDATTEMDRLLRDYLPNSDVVWVSRPHNMARLLERHPALGACSRLKIVYDAEAVFAMRDRLLAELRGAEVPAFVFDAMLERELALAKAAHAVTVVSQSECCAMLRSGAQSVHVLAHALAPQPGPATVSQRRDFLFVGAMHGSSTPNEDSVRYFCAQIWPQVRAATGADFIIAGYGTREALPQDLGAGVRVIGLQPDLTAVYDSARVFVAPTRYAAGVPHKAHEAAARGIPMVVSGLIGEQLGWIDRKDFLVAGSPADFSRACVELYNNEDLWQDLRTSALERVRAELSREQFAATIADVLEEVTSG